ncbi:MAG: deoxyribonuclease IV [Gordonia sp. (in: high G+C Gram-positive bacteria)]
MRIGAHLRQDDDPLATAADLGIDVFQMFVTDPQKFHKPVPNPRAQEFRDSPIDVVVHSSYRINVASRNNRIRMPSRKAVAEQATAAADLGAIGLVVHGGYLGADEDAAEGFLNWHKLFDRQAGNGGFGLPILIENTAGGGDRAMARTLEAIDRLWDAVGEFDEAGFCLDTCHAWAGGEDLVGLVDRVRAITGRIDLVHLNNSRDEFDSGRDRHANLESGQIDADVLVAVARAADAPIILETPADGVQADLAYLRAAR